MSESESAEEESEVSEEDEPPQQKIQRTFGEVIGTVHPTRSVR
jgi:hypothetical protein